MAYYKSLFDRLLGYGTEVASGHCSTGKRIEPVTDAVRPLELKDAHDQIGARLSPGPSVAMTPRTPPRNRSAVIIGDGEFGFPVVGEAHHQDALEALAGGRREWSAHIKEPALLLPQPDNPYDPDAVAVSMHGHEVGYLARNVAPEFLRALQAGGYDRATCEAMIVGGWERGADDRGWFGVRLNACRPFRLEPVEA
jgi:HIRAN domain